MWPSGNYWREKAKYRFFENVQKLKDNPTFYEIVFKEWLDEKGIAYRFQEPLVHGAIVDFYLPEFKMAVEIDGRQHKDDQHRVYDSKRDAKIRRETGCRLIRIENPYVRDRVYLMKLFHAFGIDVPVTDQNRYRRLTSRQSRN